MTVYAMPALMCAKAATESVNESAMSAEEAAARVVRALEDRPVVWNIPIGVAGELVGFVAPRLMDAVMWRLDQRTNNSAAASGQDAAS